MNLALSQNLRGLEWMVKCVPPLPFQKDWEYFLDGIIPLTNLSRKFKKTIVKHCLRTSKMLRFSFGFVKYIIPFLETRPLRVFLMRYTPRG